MKLASVFTFAGVLACFLPRATHAWPLQDVGAGHARPASTQKLPYIYTHWKQFTMKDGLPNDHIFAVKADGPRVWIGTEGGLAMLDKRTGKIKSWTEKAACPGAW